MPSHRQISSVPAVGLIGFGAFGQLIATHLARHTSVHAYDPHPPVRRPRECPARLVDLADAAACPVVILAVPVSALADAIAMVNPHLRPGTLVVDVGSVKLLPVAIMQRDLPADVEILATHPLFGPQSARAGIRGLKIAICPIRGRQGLRFAAFLRQALGLRVIVTTPEAHDREAALVQGLTHLIAKTLVGMEPLPNRMTTRSFDLLMEAIGMVRDDPPAVFQAIERDNPFAADARRRFMAVAAEIEAELYGRHPASGRLEQPEDADAADRRDAERHLGQRADPQRSDRG